MSHPRTLFARVLLFGVGALAVACGGPDDEGPSGPDDDLVPATLTGVQGDGQEARAGEEVPEDLVVRVETVEGVGVPGHEVRWEVSVGGGSAVPATTLTDQDGRASTRWRLGSEIGDQRVEASAGELVGSPVTFQARALEPPEDAIESKIDPPLLARLESGGPIPVIALGSAQLLLGSGAMESFQGANAGRMRSVLRREMTGLLKETAEVDREAILDALGRPDDALGLWIMNAVVATVTPNDVRRASRSDRVARLYLAEGFPGGSGGLVDQVEAILTPGSREPFTVGGREVPWNLEDVGARRVWEELGVDGEGVTVALIDAGTDYLHPDLRENVWINEGETPNNGEDDDGNGLVDDYYGWDFNRGSPRVRSSGSAHGTYTAGIVAGDGSGGIITGVAPRSRIQILRISGTVGQALNLQYALETGADVATMSFSLPGLGNLRGLWRLMADHATAAGLVQVSGAGNFRQTATVPVQLRTPEDIPSVVAVGGVSRELQVTSFSSMGPVDWSGVHFYRDHPALIKPDVAAFPGPGYPLLRPFTSGYVAPNDNLAGNSFSGPHAAGIAALMLSANPELPAWEVAEILEATARDLPPSGRDNDTGEGLLDAYAAVQEALRR